MVPTLARFAMLSVSCIPIPVVLSTGEMVKVCGVPDEIKNGVIV
jgi:hypothetical protein